MTKVELLMLKELLHKFWDNHEWPHPMITLEPFKAIEKRVDEELKRRIAE